jgi:prepilin-type N-terminal cleavage/methylation domain-containing protein
MRSFRRKLAGLRPGGFTLVELAVVSAILAGLAVAVVTYVGSTSQTVNTEMTATVGELRTGVDTSSLGSYGGGSGPAPRVVFVSGAEGWSVADNGATIRCGSAPEDSTAEFLIDGVATTITRASGRSGIKFPQDALFACTSAVPSGQFYGLWDWQEFGGSFEFNADVFHWDVSHVEGSDMENMFLGVVGFNRDLSAWTPGCATDTPPTEAPAGFYPTDPSSWTLPKPSWGAPCPG